MHHLSMAMLGSATAPTPPIDAICARSLCLHSKLAATLGRLRCRYPDLTGHDFTCGAGAGPWRPDDLPRSLSVADMLAQVLTAAQADAYRSNRAGAGIDPRRVSGFVLRLADLAGLGPEGILSLSLIHI